MFIQGKGVMNGPLIVSENMENKMNGNFLFQSKKKRIMTRSESELTNQNVSSTQ